MLTSPLAHDFRKQLQTEPRRLVCTECTTEKPHPMSLAQLKLLVILKVHLSMWNNARLAAEGFISDIIWPVQIALHCCQVSTLDDVYELSLSDDFDCLIDPKLVLRKTSNKILAQAVRAHRTLRVKAAKGIEVLAVTSFDAASSGLARPSNRLRANHQVAYYLETLATLWQESALVCPRLPSSDIEYANKYPEQTLRYKLSSVRREYYDVRTTWDAITSVVQVQMNPETSKQICVLLPLLAYANPTSFGYFALQDVVAVLTSTQARNNGKFSRNMLWPL